MRISVTKILLIIVFAAALGLVINYLQPESLPLYNENKNEAYRIDEKLNPPPAEDKNSAQNSNNSIKEDFNKASVEKNRVQINEDLLPSYDYKNDSDLEGKNAALQNKSGNNEDIDLSNLIKDAFNQPRLISLTQAYELYKDKILFVDARNPEEFEEGHIAGAINLPYFSFDEYVKQLAAFDKTEPLVTYCEGADCDMSIRLGNELFSKGFKKVFVFFGGWEEWKKADYPMVTSDPNLQLN